MPRTPDEFTPAAREYARQTIHSWHDLHAQLDDYSLCARLEHRRWQHIQAYFEGRTGEDGEGHRIAGGWTKAVFTAEWDRYATMMDRYNAAMAVGDEFWAVIDHAFLSSPDPDNERIYAALVRVHGAQEDGSVLLQLPMVGAFLLRPDDSLALPPWMRDDAPDGTP